jgi:drug/metabolite transporter (DMT)-like permease
MIMAEIIMALKEFFLFIFLTFFAFLIIERRRVKVSPGLLYIAGVLSLYTSAFFLHNSFDNTHVFSKSALFGLVTVSFSLFYASVFFTEFHDRVVPVYKEDE